MNKGLLKHFVVLIQRQSSIQMKDRTDDQDLDILSEHDLDVFYLLMFAVEEMLVGLGLCIILTL
jgi:hypothetical protein